MARDTRDKRLLCEIMRCGGKINAGAFRKSMERAKSESEIQQECVEWFRIHYPVLAGEGMLFHIANEGIRLGGMGVRFKREGVVRGVADLCLSVPMRGYGALYVEMKRKGTYQRPEQKAWQEAVERHGSKYAVCRSREEFAVIVNRYLKG